MAPHRLRLLVGLENQFSVFLEWLLYTGLEIIKFLLCSSQVLKSTEHDINCSSILKYRQIRKFLDLSLSDVVFIMLINVKMPIIIGILTFMNRINLLLS